MIDVNELRKGVTFTMDNEIYKVLSFQFHKPGRGNATIRTTLRNLRTGATIHHNFISGNRVEEVRVDTIEVEYLYDDSEFLHFMNLETYEQPVLNRSVFDDDDLLYLKEGMQIKLKSYVGEIIDYELPNTVDYEVVESEMAVAGDTATGATKNVTTETGLQVQVPLFVDVGDTIRVDTRDRRYITRV
ncbi:MAG: elongation factor P [Anaerolineae bacterium]|nr:elongation factor P [Anaerolineae bacterium]